MILFDPDRLGPSCMALDAIQDVKPGIIRCSKSHVSLHTTSYTYQGQGLIIRKQSLAFSIYNLLSLFETKISKKEVNQSILTVFAMILQVGHNLKSD